MQQDGGAQAASSYGARPMADESTVPTGFDPAAAALFEAWGDEQARRFLDDLKANGARIASSNPSNAPGTRSPGLFASASRRTEDS